MRAPDFFTRAPTIRLRDPLAGFLGAAAAGELEYTYLDAVMLAGHSCPTVAGAYLMTLRALERLYPGETPERGAIRVELRGAAADATVGIVANVASLITGAAGEGGFKGIAGRFVRRDLLSFEAPIAGDIRFTRLDTGACVEASLHADAVAPRPETKSLLQDALAGDATPAARDAFAALWQERVARMLVEHAGDPRLVEVRG
jgi:hypothetical protein